MEPKGLISCLMWETSAQIGQGRYGTVYKVKTRDSMGYPVVAVKVRNVHVAVNV